MISNLPSSFNDLSEVRKNLLELYKRNISDRVCVSIVQILNNPRKRSQYLALLIEDQDTGRWILLRLSSFRKVIKFVTDKGFLTSRHLKPWEKAKLQIKESGSVVDYVKTFIMGI